jgi:hypothetical protein
MFGLKPTDPKDWRSVAVLVVHGIGTRAPGFSAVLQEAVTRRMPRPLQGWTRWSEVYWGDVTRPNQFSYLRSAATENKLGGMWGWLREWVRLEMLRRISGWTSKATISIAAFKTS